MNEEALSTLSSQTGDGDGNIVIPPYEEHERRKRTLENDDLEQDIHLRRDFAWHIFWFVVIFVVLILIIVVSCGLGCSNLSDAVLIALLTTMTTTIVGLLVFVVQYLFAKK